MGQAQVLQRCRPRTVRLAWMRSRNRRWTEARPPLRRRQSLRLRRPHHSELPREAGRRWERRNCSGPQYYRSTAGRPRTELGLAQCQREEVDHTMLDLGPCRRHSEPRRGGRKHPSRARRWEEDSLRSRRRSLQRLGARHPSLRKGGHPNRPGMCLSRDPLGRMEHQIASKDALNSVLGYMRTWRPGQPRLMPVEGLIPSRPKPAIAPTVPNAGLAMSLIGVGATVVTSALRRTIATSPLLPITPCHSGSMDTP